MACAVVLCRVLVFSRSGEHERTIAVDFVPTGVSCLSNHFVVSADTDASIRIFESKSGKQVSRFGSNGSGDGQLNDPRGLTMVDGRLYVCDRFNNCVQVFEG